MITGSIMSGPVLAMLAEEGCDTVVRLDPNTLDIVVYGLVETTMFRLLIIQPAVAVLWNDWLAYVDAEDLEELLP